MVHLELKCPLPQDEQGSHLRRERTNQTRYDRFNSLLHFWNFMKSHLCKCFIDFITFSGNEKTPQATETKRNKNHKSDLCYNPANPPAAINIGYKNVVCSHCRALKWVGLAPGLCCTDKMAKFSFLLCQSYLSLPGPFCWEKLKTPNIFLRHHTSTTICLE